MAGVDKPSDRPLSVSHDSGKTTMAASQQQAHAAASPPMQKPASSHGHAPSSPSSSSSSSPSPLPNTARAHSRTTLPPPPSSSSPSSSSAATTTIPAPAPSYMDAVRTLRPADLATVHQKPCARESLLTGMGAGFGVGGLRFILLHGSLRARQYPAMSWAVGAFVLASGGAHAFCQRRRALEKAAMARANEIMEEKKRVKRDEALQRKKRIDLEKEEREGGLWKWVGWK